MGNGWAWNDFQYDYGTERSEMPIYGNVARFFMQGDSIAVVPKVFYNPVFRVENKLFREDEGKGSYKVQRSIDANQFYSSIDYTKLSAQNFKAQVIPFKTIVDSTYSVYRRTFIRLLEDTLHKQIGEGFYLDKKSSFKKL